MPVHARLHSTATRGSWWWVPVVIVAALAHIRSLGNGFVFDDIPIVVENPALADLGLWQEWFRGFWPGHDQYVRPLSLASLALDQQLGGGRPFMFHLTNVIWHLAATVLVGSIARRLGYRASGAIAAGLAFGVHPIVTEPVNWISARGDVLATALVLAGVRIHLGSTSIARAGVAGVVLFLAMCAKESAVVGPLWVLAADLADRRSSIPTRFAPAIAAWVAYAGLRVASIGSLLPTVDAPSALHNPLVISDAATRVRWVAASVGETVRHLAWPLPLSSDYARAAIPVPTSWTSPMVVLGVGTLIAAVAIARHLRSRTPRAALVLLAAAAAWFPTSNILVLHGAMFGERFLYLPWAALALIAAPLGAVTGARRRIALVAGSITVVASTAACIMRAGDWKDDGSLFASAVAAYPNNAQANYNVGTLHLQNARRLPANDPLQLRELSTALDAFQRARSIAPDYVDAHLNEGVASFQLERLSAADAAFSTAATLAPDDPRPPFNRGRVAEAIGDSVAAIAFYQRSADLAGGGPSADALRRLRDAYAPKNR